MRKTAKILVIQRVFIIICLLLLLFAVIRIWKFEGKGASEWYTDYQMCHYEIERIGRCVLEYEQEPYWRRMEGVRNYCKI